MVIYDNFSSGLMNVSAGTMGNRGENSAEIELYGLIYFFNTGSTE